MRRFWDTLAVIVIGIFAVNVLMSMIKPYVGIVLVIGTVMLIGNHIYNQMRNF